MSDSSRIYTLEELKKLKSQTDVEKFKRTTEKDILEQSLADVDTPYLTDEELKEMDFASNRRKKDE